MNIVAVIDAFLEGDAPEGEAYAFTFASCSNPDDISITTPDGKTFVVERRELDYALSACSTGCYDRD